MTTENLYTPADIKRIRELLIKEQQGKDLLTGLELPAKGIALDHRHDSEMFVRGVLHRNTNSALGRIENIWTRELKWWYPLTLPDFLRQAADYLELPTDTRFRHNSFLKYLKVQFNKLTARQQDQVLVELGSVKGNNLKDRKEKFSKIVLDRNLGYCKIMEVINKVKES